MEYKEYIIDPNDFDVEIDEENSGYDKFIESYKVENFEVLGHNGWIDIEGIGKTIEYNIWIIKTNNNELKCADDHILMRCDNIDYINNKVDLTEIYVKNISLGDMIMTKSGPEMIMELYETDEKINMYDLQVSKNSDKLYYTNDILSHNSLWMQNIAANAANMGYNVVFFTLEMSESKVMKRLGSMRLKIPIKQYDDKSKDTEYIKSKIKDLYDGGNLAGDIAGIFDQKLGKINVKFFAAGTANINHIESHIKALEQKKGFVPDLIIVDYITLMAPVKGLGVEGNLYMKGKHLAEALRATGSKWNCPIITAMQVAKDAWNAADITLDKIPESKAIAETADTFWAIIRTEEMRRNNKYYLKLLKQRDGDFTRSKASFDLNDKFLIIENDALVDSEL